MADTIKHVPFTADLLDLVKNFDCGSEPYQMELADWIRNDALQAVEGGTLVWLYVTAAGDVVGYGSLGESNWRYPDYQAKKRSKVLIIPAVALDKRYHGKPEGVDRDGRFSSQVMQHLIAAAQRWPTPCRPCAFSFIRTTKRPSSSISASISSPIRTPTATGSRT